jgi:hypothetical protein
MKKLTKEQLDWIAVQYPPEFHAAVVKDNGVWVAHEAQMKTQMGVMLDDIYKHFPYRAIRAMLFARPDTMTNEHEHAPVVYKLLFTLSEPFWAYEEEHGPQPSFYLTQAEGAARIKAEIAKMTPAECRAELAGREANRALIETWLIDYKMEQRAA